MYYVYVYRDPRENKNNAPIYIGKGQDKTDRAMTHWLNPDQCHNPGLRSLLQILVRENLKPTIQILATFKTEKAAFAKECELIALFGRRDLKTGTLFNLTAGGEGTSELSEEVRLRRAATSSATKSTPDGRLVQSRIAKAAWQNPETRKKHLAAMEKTLADPNYRVKLSTSIRESHSNPEVIEKIAAASKEHWQDPAYRQKRAESLNAVIATPEHKERRGSATKAGWQDPEVRAKRVDGIKASRTTELRKQIGESCAKLWTDEKRREQSEKMKKTLASPEARMARSISTKEAWSRRKKGFTTI